MGLAPAVRVGLGALGTFFAFWVVTFERCSLVSVLTRLALASYQFQLGRYVPLAAGKFPRLACPQFVAWVDTSYK